MPSYTLIEYQATYSLQSGYPEIDAEVLRQALPEYIDDIQWSLDLGRIILTGATDEDSPWQILSDDGGYWIIESFEINDEKTVSANFRLYWKNSENARSFTEEELTRWLNLSDDSVRVSDFNRTISSPVVVDYNKPYRS